MGEEITLDPIELLGIVVGVITLGAFISLALEARNLALKRAREKQKFLINNYFCLTCNSEVQYLDILCPHCGVQLLWQ